MTFGAKIFLKEILLISELFGFQNYRKSVDPSYLSGEKLAVMSTQGFIRICPTNITHEEYVPNVTYKDVYDSI